MEGDAVTLPDQSCQATRVEIGVLFLLRQGELQHRPLEFDRALAPSLPRQERTEPQLLKSLLNLIEAFPAEAELTAGLGDGIFVDRMGT